MRHFSELEIDGDRAACRKHVSGSEPFALGHYPGDPIFPGVLMLQLIFDLSEALVDSRHAVKGSRLAALKSVQFLDKVLPGDTIHIESVIAGGGEQDCLLKAQVTSGDKIKVKCQLRVGIGEGSIGGSERNRKP